MYFLWNLRSLPLFPLSIMTCKPQLPNVCWGLISYDNLPVCTFIINLGHFSLVHLSLLTWILAQLEECRRWEEKYFFSPTYVMGIPQERGTWGQIRQLRLIWYLELRRSGVVVWDLKGQEYNPHADGKASVCLVTSFQSWFLSYLLHAETGNIY